MDDPLRIDMSAVRISLYGEMTQVNAGQLVQAIGASNALEVDLSALTFVDSAGLGALMLIQRVAAERRQVVVLRNPSEEMRFLLTITKLYDLFIVDTSYD